MEQVRGAGVCVEWSRSEGQVYVLDGAGSGAGVCLERSRSVGQVCVEWSRSMEQVCLLL